MTFDPSDITRDAYFPTLVYSHQDPAPADFNSALLDLIHGEQNRDRDGIQRSNFSQLGGWHSHNDLHKNPAYGALSDRIHAAADKVSGDLGYHKGYALRIGTMWSIINAPGSSNRAHIHPGCTWSGVYYIQAPKGCGSIEFIDPRTENLMFQPRFVPNRRRPKPCWTKVNVTPKAGKMLIFPSWLYHSVAPNLSTGTGRDAERVIISFNLSQVKTPAARKDPQGEKTLQSETVA